MKRHHTLGICADLGGNLQRTGRWRIAVDFRITLIRQDLEIVLVGQSQQRTPILSIGNRPLRIGG